MPIRRIVSLVAMALMLGRCLLPIGNQPSGPPGAIGPSDSAQAPAATPVGPTADQPPDGLFARQAALESYHEALSLELAGTGPLGRQISPHVWAEGEYDRPSSHLDVHTDALWKMVGYESIQAGAKTYIQALGFWWAVDGGAPPKDVAPVPVPLIADPSAMTAILGASQFTPAQGDPVRGAPVRYVLFAVPPERVPQIATQLVLPKFVPLLIGTPTYTAVHGEIAVGQEDGLVRLVAVSIDGYANGDQQRTFSLKSQTELWDVNDPTITVAAPTDRVIGLPAFAGLLHATGGS